MLKKIISSILILPISSFFLISCNNIDKDAKRLAEVQCQALSLIEKNKSLPALDVSLIEQAKELHTQITDLKDELSKKYTSESDRQKLATLVSEYTSACNK